LSKVHRIFTATLLLGNPGSGKTSLLASFAEYLWETFHRVVLLYSWDGGAIPTNVQRLMKAGLIRFWRARTRSGDGLGLETLYFASKGYWPRAINVETGETTPAVDLTPPVTTLYTVHCSKTGERLAQLPTRSAVGPTYCAPCKTLHSGAELNVTEETHRTRGFELVGGVAFDGLTSMTNTVLEHMDDARGQGQIGGEKSSFGGVVTSGVVKMGGNNRADVGFGQSRGMRFVNNSLSIPYLVEGPVFTALSMEATDEGGLPIVGAKLPGRAATDEASSWFGNVYEMGKTLDEKGREHFTLFLRPFTDPQGRRHLLKTSASPTGLPDKLIDPIDAPWSQANLGVVFTLLDTDLRQAMADEIVGAPGLSNTPAEYGDSFHTTPTPAEPPPAAVAPLPLVATAAGTGTAAVVTPPPVVGRRRTHTATSAVAEPPAAPPPPGMKPPMRVPNS